MNQIECVLEIHCWLGESPLWDPEKKLLYWADILGEKIHSFDPILQKLRTYPLTEKVTSIALRKGGGLVATSFKGFMLFDFKEGKLTPLVQVEENLPDNRFNDGKCDRSGRFWAGTMDRVHWNKPTGTLYSLQPDKTALTTEKNAVCLNGIAWSLDNRTMYVVESFRYTIFAYDFEMKTGSISNKRPFISFPSEAKGFPDGITVDSEGYIWCAIGVLGKILRIDPKGQITQTYSFPVPGITSCMFGGKDLQTLYVTSSRENMTDSDLQKYPLSGNLFSIETNVRGVPEPFVHI
ncbi:MAG: SMP-30/gluconolactonase/LRE family protein [Rhabdochlamydiaceae bacterium]|nr:SMP-30/gluconolactonase/LRE family protein [Rhabdochlamydiaceae bacterium]